MNKIDTNKIKELLSEEIKHKKKRELCRAMKISPSTLFNYLDNVGVPTLTTLERIAVIAGITKNVNNHLLRHSLASHLIPTENLRAIQVLLGHSQVATTEFYTHVAGAIVDNMSVSISNLSLPRGTPDVDNK